MSDKEPDIQPQDTHVKGDVPFTPGQDVAAGAVVKAAKVAADNRQFGTFPSENYVHLVRYNPDKYLVLDTHLNIVEVSEAYLEVTMTKREVIMGRNVFDVFPAPPDGPGGTKDLKQSFDYVIEHRRMHRMGVIRYPIKRPDGTWEERHWEPINVPIPSDGSEVRYILHRVEDVTELVTLRTETQELAEYQALREKVLKSGVSRLMGTLRGVGFAVLMTVMTVAMLFILGSLTGQSSVGDRIDQNTTQVRQLLQDRADEHCDITRSVLRFNATLQPDGGGLTNLEKQFLHNLCETKRSP